MTTLSTARSEQVRSRLDHPVIDADGHMVEFVAPVQPLDGQDLFIPNIGYHQNAGQHRLSIQQHGAGAALCFIASLLASGEPQVLPKNIQQRPGRFSIGLMDLAIDFQ